MQIDEIINLLSPAFHRQALLPAIQRQIASAYFKPGFIIFYGSKGSGKNTLLEQIYRFANTLDNFRAGKFKIKGNDHFGIQKEIRFWWESFDEQAIKLVLLENLEDLLTRDNTSEPFYIFEREILYDLVMDDHTFILATSHSEVSQWREPEINEKVLNIQLPSLNREDVALLAENSGIDGTRLYHLGLGHPQATQMVIENPLITEQKIGNWAAKYFLENLSDEHFSQALLVSQMPIFNTFILSNIVKITGGSASPYQMSILIDELMKLGLVYWTIGGHRFRDNAVRRLIARKLFWEERENYSKVHQTAAEYYIDEAVSPSFLHLHLLPAVYHMASVDQPQSQAETGEKCLRWIQDRLRSWFGADLDQVIKNWSGEAENLDIIDELKELIGEETYSQISNLLHDAKDTWERYK